MAHGGRKRTPADQVAILTRQAKQRKRLKKAGRAVRRAGMFANVITGQKAAQRLGGRIRRKKK